MQFATNQLNASKNLENHSQVFFHESETFQCFEQSIINDLITRNTSGKPLRIMVWGCGSGQEAYSVAISMYRKAQIVNTLTYEILGIDKNPQAIDRARIGLYDEASFHSDVAQRAQQTYFKKTEDEWRIAPPIKSPVQFMSLDIYDNLSSLNKADIIFARYFLTHFTPTVKSVVLEKFSDLLNPKGYLILGRQESVLSLSSAYSPYDGNRGTYQKKD